MGFIVSETVIAFSPTRGFRIEASYMHRNRIATPPPSSTEISLFRLDQGTYVK